MTNTFDILSLNAYHGVLLDQLLSYVARQKEQISVFCFQESNAATQEALDGLLLDTHAGYYASRPNDGVGFHVAVYVQRGLTVRQAEPLFNDIEGAGLALRCVIDSVSNGSVTVTCVHGQPRPGDKLDTPVRIAQSLALIGANSNDESRHVVLGDFNLLPNTESVKLFEEHGYKNLISEFNIATTRNELAWERYPDNPQLFADYAFIYGDDLSYDFRVDNEIVSDHLPLIVSLGEANTVDAGLVSADVSIAV